MTQTIRYLDRPLGWLTLFLVMFLIGSFLGLGGCGCSPVRYSPGVSASSVVTLLEPRDVGGPPGLDVLEPAGAESDGLVGSTAAYHRIAFVETCNAFAVERDALYLVTAGHCVHGHAIGDRVRFLPPDGWGHGFARLTLVDEAHDRAMLAVETRSGLVPIGETPPPGPGAHVYAASAYYQAVTAGTLVGPLGVERYGTTQTVVRGWSGSPELDVHGRVWGVVSQCAAPANGDCEPGQAIAVALP